MTIEEAEKLLTAPERYVKPAAIHKYQIKKFAKAGYKLTVDEIFYDLEHGPKSAEDQYEEMVNKFVDALRRLPFNPEYKQNDVVPQVLIEDDGWVITIYQIMKND